MVFKTYLIVHIGGASISGLAELLHRAGHKVYGWEEMNQNEKVLELEELGIEIFSKNIPSNIIKTIDCVVHSSITSSEFVRNLFSLKIETQVYTQFKFINLLIKDSNSIAITGSYGKTITTALLSHVLD